MVALMNALVSMALASPANAPRMLELEYLVPAGCPTQASFQARLAARLGYEVTGGPPTHVAAVSVVAQGSGLVATMRLREAAGQRWGERTFRSATDDCEALVSSVALALAVALDSREHPPIPEKVEPVGPVTAPPVAAVAVVPAPPARRFEGHRRARRRGTVGSCPRRLPDPCSRCASAAESSALRSKVPSPLHRKFQRRRDGRDIGDRGRAGVRARRFRRVLRPQGTGGS